MSISKILGLNPKISALNPKIFIIYPRVDNPRQRSTPHSAYTTKKPEAHKLPDNNNHNLVRTPFQALYA
jgi:hypothetical protein